tara:strand:+ start:18435 stop:19577 length:1143 start_codon:yes stop_codon:yes gene_type:complete
MHICYITAEYPVLNLPHGGVGTFVQTLGYKLIKSKFDVSVIRISNVDKVEVVNDNGVKVYLVPKSRLPFSFIPNSLKINRLIKKINKKHKIDVVETSELGLAFLRKIKGIKFVIRMHGGHHFFALAEKRNLEWKKVWQEKKSFKKADDIVAVSKYVAETTKKLLNINDKKVTVIYNPIDLNKFYQSNLEKIEEHSVFFAGTIVEKKGIRQLIQSLEYLVDEYPNIKLLIAGRDAFIPGTKEQYRPYLEGFITDKIASNIQFLGMLDNKDIPKYIEKAHVCCYPSHMEAMPIAWLEVLAMGKTFIASNIGPGYEAVSNKKTGILVNPFKPMEIAEAIRFVFKNKDLSNNFGKAAREDVLKRFNIEDIVNENIEFYNLKKIV